MTVTDGAASLIAAAADGGMRDALSILDLCASGSKNIDEETVESVCGMAGGDYLLQLADCINRRDTEGALLLTDKLYNTSVDMQRLLSELTLAIPRSMIIKTVKGDNKPIFCSEARLKALTEQAAAFDIKDIMHALTLLQASAAGIENGNRRCEMEMALIRLCTPSLSNNLLLARKKNKRTGNRSGEGGSPADRQSGLSLPRCRRRTQKSRCPRLRPMSLPHRNRIRAIQSRWTAAHGMK